VSRRATEAAIRERAEKAGDRIIADVRPTTTTQIADGSDRMMNFGRARRSSASEGRFPNARRPKRGSTLLLI